MADSRTSGACGRQRPCPHGYAILVVAVQLSALVAFCSGQEAAAGGYCVASDCGGSKWQGACAQSPDSCEVGCLGTWCPAASTPENNAPPPPPLDDGGGGGGGFCVAKDCDGQRWSGLCSANRKNCEVGCFGTWCPAGLEASDPQDEADVEAEADAYYCGPKSCDGNVWGGVCGSSRYSCGVFCGGAWCPLTSEVAVGVTTKSVGTPAELPQVESPPAETAAAAAAASDPSKSAETTAPVDDSDVVVMADGWYCGPKSCNGKAWGGVCGRSAQSCDVFCGGSWCPLMIDAGVEEIMLSLDESAADFAASQAEEQVEEIVQDQENGVVLKADGWYCGPKSCNGKSWGGACAKSPSSCDVFCGGSWCPLVLDKAVEEDLPPPAVAAETVPVETAETVPVETAESTPEPEEVAAVDSQKAAVVTTTTTDSAASWYCGPTSCTGAVWGGSCGSGSVACSMICGGEWCPPKTDSPMPDNAAGPPMNATAPKTTVSAQEEEVAEQAEPKPLPDTWYCGPASCSGSVWGGSCAASKSACVMGCLGTWCPPMIDASVDNKVPLAEAAVQDTAGSSPNTEVQPKPLPVSSYCGPKSCDGSVWGGSCAASKSACEGGCLGTWCSPMTDSLVDLDALVPEVQPKPLPHTWHCGPASCDGSVWGGSCATSKSSCEGGCLGKWCPPMVDPPEDDREPIGFFCGPPSCGPQKWKGPSCGLNEVACEVGCGGSWCPEYVETFLDQQISELFGKEEETAEPQQPQGAPRIYTIWGSRDSPFEQGIISKNGLFEQP